MSEASKQGIKIYKVDNTLGSKEWFDLDLKHVTWKSIGIIYLFGATPAPSLVLWYWFTSNTGGDVSAAPSEATWRGL